METTRHALCSAQTLRDTTLRASTLVLLLAASGAAHAATLTVADLIEGDLVISEIMVDPSRVADGKGEWLEIYNASGADVDLNGLVLSDDGTDSRTVSGSVVVLAGGSAVLAANGTSDLNGGNLAVDYVYARSHFVLDNTADEVVLRYGATEFDRVAWDVTGGLSATAGVSISLDVHNLDATKNDDPGVWCDASTPYGLGDLGTPGDPNDDCGLSALSMGELVRGDLVITEVMVHPSKVTEGVGEWFEIYNASGQMVNLNGLILKDRGTDTYTVASSLLVDADSHALLATKSKASLNGGLPTVDLAYTRSSLKLDNTADEIVLSNGSIDLDEVAWTRTSGLTTGASWSLDINSTDADGNDVAANWCAGTEAYGLGDRGSPGAINHRCGDGDLDGYIASEDCDDTDGSVHPGATEICDLLDDDCDGAIDEGAEPPSWWPDGDGDGYGDAAGAVVACANPDGALYLSNATDCDDTDAAVSPAATEICSDGVDNNCDGAATGCVLGGDQDLSLADAKMTGNATTTDASRGLAGLGDINGDGFDDIGVGAPSTALDAAASSSGAAYVVYGPISGARSLSSSADARLTGETGGDQAGYSLSGLGDQDGDGYGDLLVGARDEGTGGAGAGAVYVVSGPLSGSASLSTADAKLTGEGAANVAGFVISGGGDVDGDDTPDLLVGAYGNSDAAAEAGATYLFFGPVLDSGSLGGADAILTGEVAGDRAGRWISSGGDVDGDGSADLLIGAYASDGAGTTVDIGRSYLVFGPVSGNVDLGDADALYTGAVAGEQSGHSVDDSGDADGDGYDDLLIGAVASKAGGGVNCGSIYLVSGPAGADLSLGAADAILTGVTTGDHAGGRAAFVGDLDRDGFDDILIGANGQDAGGSNAGAAYVLYGPLAGTASLSTADSRLIGEVAGDKAGTSIAGAGDVNADGYADLLVGAVSEATGGTSAGAAYLVLGRGL